MNENEDYLESLLKAASSNDNPDSALSRAREFTKNLAEQIDMDTNPEASDELANETELADLLASDDLSVVIDDVDEASEILDKTADLDVFEAEVDMPIDSATIEAVEEQVEELEKAITSSEQDTVSDVEKSENTLESAEPEVIEEIDIDSLLSDDPGIENTFPSDEELDKAQEVAEAEQKAIDGEADIDDIDKLLNSDFSGEINLDEGLLDSVNIDSLDTSAEETEAPLAESSDSDEEAPLEDFDLASIENLINEESTADSTSEEAVDELSDLSQEDIEKMLDAANDNSEEPQGEIEIDLNDLAALENEFGIVDKDKLSDESIEGNEELKELSGLFDSIDSDEVMSGEDEDMLNILNEAVTKSVEADEEKEASKAKKKSDDDEAEAATGKKKGKKKKVKKKEKTGEVDAALKEKGKIAKFFDFLTAEEESEEESLINPIDAEGNEDVPDGENKEILNEIDSEEASDGKKKKKKDKKKKGKKGKDKGEESEEPEDGESGEESEEGDKKKKPKKEKKPRKPLELDVDTGKPLNKKNVILIFIMCISVMVAIILVVKLIPPILAKKEARDAFYKGDYELTYTTFFGEKKLKESDQILYDRSFIILKVRHKYDSFAAYRKLNMEVEALDQLLQAVAEYDNWSAMASACGADKQFAEEYSRIIGALSTVYGLSETQAIDICALETDLEYSLKVESVINNTPYIDPNDPFFEPGPVSPVDGEQSDDTEQDILREEGM